MKGIPALVIATLLYGLYGVYARMIGIDFGIFSQNSVRYLLVSGMTFMVIIWQKNWKPPKREDWKWILVWIMSDLTATIGIFVAFNKITIGTAYFLFYAGSILTGYLIGKLFFQEKINIFKIFSLILSFLGLMLIYALEFETSRMFWPLLALGSGVAVGLFNTFSKKLSGKYPIMELVFLDAAIGFLISFFIAMLLQEKTAAISLSLSWLGILLYAISHFFTVQLLVYGFKHTEAQLGSLVMPLEMVFGAVFGFIFFREILPLSTIAGGLLIVCAFILPNLVVLRKPKIKKDG